MHYIDMLNYDSLLVYKRDYDAGIELVFHIKRMTNV